jgi:hypothetical protein
MPGSHSLALLRGLAPTHRLGGDEIILGREISRVGIGKVDSLHSHAGQACHEDRG